MITHLLAERKADKFITACGSDGEHSAWYADINCPLCITRLYLHRRVTQEDVLTLVTDLDNEFKIKRFHFTGKRWRFRWIMDERLVYVYDDEQSTNAAYALHIEAGEASTYENAQTTAKMHILLFESRNGQNTVAHKAKTRRIPPVKKAPTGPHCDVCLKPDEGDCVESPDDETKLRCMPCFVERTMRK